MEVGYGDFGFFRNIFKRLTGLTPQEYKHKFGQMFNEAVAGQRLLHQDRYIYFTLHHFQHSLFYCFCIIATFFV